MKKLVLFIALIFIGFLAKAQISNPTGFYVNALEGIILKGDTIRYFFTVTPNDTIVSKNYVDSLAADGGHALVTLDISAINGGLAIFGQELFFTKASDSTSGYISATDFQNFTNKLSFIYHNETLMGDGTIESPLGIDTTILANNMKTVYELTLPAASTIDGRIIGAVEGVDYPSGWVLNSGNDPADLEISHNVGKRVANVNVFYNVSGTEFRQLVNFNNAYTGILTPSLSTIRIEGLATIQKEIKIYIMFTQ